MFTSGLAQKNRHSREAPTKLNRLMNETRQEVPTKKYSNTCLINRVALNTPDTEIGGK